MKSFKNHINDILSEKFKKDDIYNYVPKFEEIFKDNIIDTSKHHTYAGAGSVVEIPNSSGSFEFTIAVMIETLVQCDPTLELSDFGLDNIINDQEHGGAYWVWLVKTYLKWLKRVKNDTGFTEGGIHGGVQLREVIKIDLRVTQNIMHTYLSYA